MFNILDLPEKLVVGDGIELLRDTKKHIGKYELSDIVWYEYRITNHKEKGIVYDNIGLTFFKITEEVRLSAEKSIIENNVTKAGVIRPHIDYGTGNIHPSKEYVEEMAKQEKVFQLVLCKGLGPNTPMENGENIYLYKNRPRQKGARIHKACYYPLIEDDPTLYNDWRYRLLQEMWDKLFHDQKAEFASDCELDNVDSMKFHVAL